MTELVIDTGTAAGDSANGGYTCGRVGRARRRRARSRSRCGCRRRSSAPLAVVARHGEASRCATARRSSPRRGRARARPRAAAPRRRRRGARAPRRATRAPTSTRSPSASSAGRRASRATGCVLRPGPVDGERRRRRWTPDVVRGDGRRAEFVWAALDCPGAFAVELGRPRGTRVLGRLTARIDRAPGARARRCVVVGWPLGGEGRRQDYAGTALCSARDGRLARSSARAGLDRAAQVV